MFEDILDNPMFWILAGGAVIAEVIAYVWSRNNLDYHFPFWQFLILVAGTIVASAFFANQD